jgi:hypothetical protein
VAGDPPRVARLDAQHLDAHAGLAQRGQALAVEEGALAAGGPPLLARAEVLDVGVLHVAHRQPVRDGDRHAVEGHAALGVQRAVDRVDHHLGRAAAVDGHAPALL